MGKRISFNGWYLTRKTVMKKAAMAIITGVMLLALSSCGQAEDSEDTQTNVTDGTAETGGIAGEVQETQNDNIAGSSDSDLAELENLTGEYEYLSELGTGRLIIQKTSNGYDICDYESESLYRFLAGSFDIETIENNRIYLKYPEQVFSDDTVIFSYYVLEYGTDEIDVYCGESGFEETQFLYHATKKKEEGSEFAAGEGNALNLSYVYYNGAIWIMYRNRMNAGYESYHMEKYEGADNLAAEIDFGEEPVDPNNSEFGMKYTWNGTEISYDEYTALCSKILAAEVNTNTN